MNFFIFALHLDLAARDSCNC